MSDLSVREKRKEKKRREEEETKGGANRDVASEAGKGDVSRTTS